jgi:hypothetical protein
MTKAIHGRGVGSRTYQLPLPTCICGGLQMKAIGSQAVEERLITCSFSELKDALNIYSVTLG